MFTNAAIIAQLTAGKPIALITDAGTPLVSDPGSRLVAAATLNDIPVVAIPGASALLAALVVSGIPADQFTFIGFLPRKGRDRQRAIEVIVRSTVATVIYEAPGRVADTLHDIAGAGAGDRAASVSRELTKKFEETRRGTVSSLAVHYETADAKGEFVIVIAGAEDRESSDEELREAVAEMKRDGTSSREITDRLMSQFGIARNRAYKLAHE